LWEATTTATSPPHAALHHRVAVAIVAATPPSKRFDAMSDEKQIVKLQELFA
jgi:hypothetical protein